MLGLYEYECEEMDLETVSINDYWYAIECGYVKGIELERWYIEIMEKEMRDFSWWIDRETRFTYEQLKLLSEHEELRNDVGNIIRFWYDEDVTELEEDLVEFLEECYGEYELVEKLKSLKVKGRD